MRRALFALTAALLLATTACAAAGGGNGAPKDAPANATTAPSFMPTPTGGQAEDPYGY
jgi:ABC-type glycerol-3-phosphate transport system substrate-binding protein